MSKAAERQAPTSERQAKAIEALAADFAVQRVTFNDDETAYVVLDSRADGRRCAVVVDSFGQLDWKS